MNGTRLQQIKSELACCRQRGLAIETYYGKLMKIWDSMASHRPLRVCKCGKCVCDLGTIQKQDREEDKVHQFLFGLDDAVFLTMRSSLVSRVPVQPMEEVYNIVRQEEDLIRTGTKSQDEQPEVAAFAVQSKPRTTFRPDDKDKTTLCKHCHRYGHASETCFAVIGYPEWWGDRPKTRTMQGRGRGGAAGSGTGGGRVRGRGTTYVNAVHVPPVQQNTEHANYVITEKDRDGVNGLSDGLPCQYP
uniref:Retrotransposon gag domain-containing protein n=1 Tax=Noccaea caerulescens TaxID=107243 RepID=A0A1J3JMY8_NOCCA